MDYEKIISGLIVILEDETKEFNYEEVNGILNEIQKLQNKFISIFFDLEKIKNEE